MYLVKGPISQFVIPFFMFYRFVVSFILSYLLLLFCAGLFCISFIIIFFSHVFFNSIFTAPSALAGEISCLSCSSEQFCSPSTVVGVIREDGSEIRKYSLPITFSCSECSGRVLRVYFDDGTRKEYVKEEKNISEGENSTTLNFSGFEITDGHVDVTFELSVTSPEGYKVEDNFICKVYYDDYPEPPSDVRAFGKESAFQASWKHRDRDIKHFEVFTGYPDDCSSGEPIITSDFQVEITSVHGETVRDGVRYCGFVRAVDVGGKISQPSEKFYVVPAKTFSFGREGPPDENVGCIIAHFFGRNSSITSYLRDLRDFMLKIPGGRYIVNIYYILSHHLIKLYRSLTEKFISVFDSISSDAFAYENKGYFLLLGGGFSSYTKAGNIDGKSTFSLIYGERIPHIDVLFAKNVVWKINVAINTKPSYVRGKRLVYLETLKVLDEFYSSIFFLPFWVGVDFFGEFVDEQIFVPYLGAFLGGNLFFETYDVGGSKLGFVGGFSASVGGNLLLDMFDSRSAALAKIEYGVENTYLSFRVSFQNINIVRERNKIAPKLSKYFDFSGLSFTVGVLVNLR